MNSWNLRTCLGACVCALLSSACSDGGSSTPEITSRGVNGTYLHVTHQQQALGENTDQVLYYGTQSVGTTTSSAVRIANRGADIYPLNHISIVGDQADQFSVDVIGEVILNPAEVLTVDVAFRPTTQNEIVDARFTIDYDTIQMVDESVNVNEQSYYKADELASAGDLVAARKTYNTYLQNDPVTSNKRRAAIRLPIIDEAQTYNGEDDLDLYLEAMSYRDEKNYDEAIKTLDRFTQVHGESYLADDADYLKGYIQLIDMDDPANAMISMQTLRENHPDTTYYDTSLYSEAIALIDSGNLADAKVILIDLKTRHTGIDTLGIQLPKDNLLSRMWFERANQMLESV